MKQIKNIASKQAEYKEGMRLFTKAKEKTLHSMAKFGNRHRLLRWPVFILLVVFLFMYNLFYYAGLHFHLKDRIARGIAVAMSFIMIFSFIDVSTLATLAFIPEAGVKVVSINCPGDIKVPYGTEEENIGLPTSLTAVLEIANEAGADEDIETSDESTTVYEGEVQNEVFYSEPGETVFNEVTKNDSAEKSSETTGDIKPVAEENFDIVPVAEENSEIVPATEENTEIVKEESGDTEQIEEEASVTEPTEEVAENDSETEESEETNEDNADATEPQNEENGSTIVTETVDLPVTWKCAGFDPDEAGEYLFEAKLPAKIGDVKLDYSSVTVPTVKVTVLTLLDVYTANVGDVQVILSADKGVFPENVTLSVTEIKDSEEAEEIEEAVGEIRDEEIKVTTSFLFDIKVLDEDGCEVQPDTTKGSVNVTFVNRKIADSNLETNVYHIHEGEACELPVKENGSTAMVETDGFSYYVVEFTYDSLEYVLPGDSKTELKTILDYVHLYGEVTSAASSNEELFKVYKDNGIWYVEAFEAFSSQETLFVTINSTMYEIIVTDASWDLQASVDPNSSYTPTQIVNGDFNDYPRMGYVLNGTRYEASSLPRTGFTGGSTITTPIYNGIGEGWNTTERQISNFGLLYDFCKIVGGTTSAPVYDTYSIANTYNNDLYISAYSRNGGQFTTSNPYSFIEMNYFAPAVFWQDLHTQGGDVILWTLEHAARGDNYESIHVEIGKPKRNGSELVMPTGLGNETKETNIEEDSKAVYRYNGVTNGSLNAGVSNGSELGNLRISGSEPKQWKSVKGFYIIPEDQDVTRFSFISDEPGDANGNLLDSLTFSTMIGNINAEQFNDGTVVVTGYWGETAPRQLVCKIGEQTLRIDMSNIIASNNKNFKVVIPKEIVDGNLSLSVYHEDYPSASKTVKIIPQNVAIPVSVKFDKAPDFDSANVKLKFELSAVSAKDSFGNDLSTIPQPADTVIELQCPSGTETVECGIEETPWHFAISKPGTYTYDVSYVASSGPDTIEPVTKNTIIVNATLNGEDIEISYEVKSDVNAELNGDVFMLAQGIDSIPSTGRGKGASIETKDGITKLLVGGTMPVNEDAFDSASIKSIFAIDFSENFVIEGTITSPLCPDGAAIGFVPDPTPQTEKEVHKWWLNGVFGGTLSQKGDAPVKVNGNGVFIEFDCWGNQESKSVFKKSNDNKKASDDAYLCSGNNSKGYALKNAMSGRHIVLLKTDANGQPVADDSIVTNASLINMPEADWPTNGMDYTITYDASTKKLRFVVGEKVDLVWDNPTDVFSQSSLYKDNKAYLILGANVRYGKYGTNGVIQGKPVSTTMTFEDIYYYTPSESTAKDSFILSEYKNTKVILNPGSAATSKGTESTLASYGSNLSTITIPVIGNGTFVGYYDENGKKYIGDDGKGCAAWDKHVQSYTLNAKYIYNRAPVTVIFKKDAATVTGITYGDNVSTALSGTPEEAADATVKYYYALKGSSTATEWDGANPPLLTAGTYEFYAVIGATENYKSYTTQKSELKVEKAERDNTVCLVKDDSEITEYTYKESVNVAIKSEVKENATVKYFYYKAEDTTSVKEWDVTNPPTLQAGNYKLYASVGETDNYKVKITDEVEFTVKKIKDYVEEDEKPEGKTGLVYDGSAQELIVPGTPIDGGKIVYSFEKDGEYSESIPTATDSGEYTVYYKIVGRNNYEDYACENPIIVSIAKADIDDFVAPQSLSILPEKGDLQNLVSAGTTEFGTVYYKLGEDGTYSTEIPQAKERGTYRIYYKVVGDSNHNDLAENYVETVIDHDYLIAENGNKITANCALSECEKNEEASFGTLVINAEDKTYDGKTDPIASITEDITEKLGGSVGSIFYRGTDGTEYDESTDVPVNAGKYEAFVKYTFRGEEYTAVVPFVINKADSELITPPQPKKRLFETGKKQNLVSPGEAKNGTIVYKIGENGTYSEEIPQATKPGKYKVYYKVIGDENYNDTEENYFIIEITEVTPPLPDPDDEPEPEPELPEEPKKQTPDRKEPVKEPQDTEPKADEPAADEKTADETPAEEIADEEERGSVTIRYEEGKDGKNIDIPKEDIYDNCLDDEEQKKVEEGENVVITIKTKETEASENAAEKLEKSVEELEEEGKIVIVGKTPFVIDLTKQVGSNKPETIKKTNGKMGVSMQVPQDLAIDGAKYYLVSENGEIITAAATVVDGITKITFDTDDFASVYSLVAVVDEGKVNEGTLKSLDDLGFVTGDLLGKNTKNKCHTHIFSFIVLLLSVIIELLTRKKRAIMLSVAGIGSVATLLLAIFGSCMYEWLALAAVVILSAVILIANLEVVKEKNHNHEER